MSVEVTIQSGRIWTASFRMGAKCLAVLAKTLQSRPQALAKNVLMVTVTDDESRRIEQQSDSETLEEIMAVLQNMFGKGIPRVESIYVPRWVADPLFRGSYTNWPVGADPIVFQQLQAPVQNIYFTGEYTSQLYSGYVHGAHLQGMAVATSLLDCKENSQCAMTDQVYENLSKECTDHLEAERDREKKIWSKKIARLEKELAEGNH